MQIDYDRLTIGDSLVREKNGIVHTHHGLYAGFKDNLHWVAENQLDFGVRYIPLNQFLSEGNLIEVSYKNYPVSIQKEIIKRIEKRIGRPYFLLTHNDKHFVNEVLVSLEKISN